MNILFIFTLFLFIVFTVFAGAEYFVDVKWLSQLIYENQTVMHSVLLPIMVILIGLSCFYMIKMKNIKGTGLFIAVLFMSIPYSFFVLINFIVTIGD